MIQPNFRGVTAPASLKPAISVVIVAAVGVISRPARPDRSGRRLCRTPMNRVGSRTSPKLRGRYLRVRRASRHRHHPLPTEPKGLRRMLTGAMSDAFLRRRDRTARPLRVVHYSAAVNIIPASSSVVHIGSAHIDDEHVDIRPSCLWNAINQHLAQLIRRIRTRQTVRMSWQILP